MLQRLARTPGAVMVLVAWLASAAGCSPPPNTPDPAKSGSTGWIVSGTVSILGSGGAVPASSGSVFGWINDVPGNGGEAIGGTRIGPAGFYQFKLPAGTSRVRLQGPLFQPCGVTIESTGHDITADIQLVSDTSLLGASLPAELRTQGPLLTGLVYEQTPQGPRPLSNVSVQLRHYEEDGFLIASTMTDADGQYMLCRVPFLTGLTLVTFAAGFNDVETYLGTAIRQTQDVEMRRQ